jgi:hypothetical protein
MTNRLKEFAEDLLNLEINTIVKDNITGRKMYGARLALIQIAKKFNIKLRQLDPAYQIATESLFGSPESFEEIKERASNKIRDYQKSDNREDNADLWMLYRIKGTSKTILNLFNNLKPELLKKLRGNKKFWDETKHINDIRTLLPFPPEQLRIIRKAWELGVEEIAMQTVIQLDGDVITRVLPKYANEKYNGLHNLHNQGITTSIKFWKILVDIVKEVIGFIISLFK